MEKIKLDTVCTCLEQCLAGTVITVVFTTIGWERTDRLPGQVEGQILQESLWVTIPAVATSPQKLLVD